MAVRSYPAELEAFLQTTPNDTQDAPWMVVSDLQVLDAERLRQEAERLRLEEAKRREATEMEAARLREELRRLREGRE